MFSIILCLLSWKTTRVIIVKKFSIRIISKKWKQNLKKIYQKHARCMQMVWKTFEFPSKRSYHYCGKIFFSIHCALTTQGVHWMTLAFGGKLYCFSTFFNSCFFFFKVSFFTVFSVQVVGTQILWFVSVQKRTTGTFVCLMSTKFVV